MTRRGLLTAAWLRAAPPGPVDWVAVRATPGQVGDAAAATFPAASGEASEPAGRRPPVTVDPARCLPFCQVCVERCPVPGALSAARHGPVVAPAACDGCGLCLEVCPSPGRPLSNTASLPVQPPEVCS